MNAQEISGTPLVTLSSPLPGSREGRDPARAIKRGPSQLPPEIVAATQRDRLFDGLAQTVARNGYVAARVTDICQAAGVTRPVFYALFEGKQDAFIATYRHGIDVLVKVMESAYLQAEDWQEGAKAAIAALLNILASAPEFAIMAVVEIDAAGPAARRERDAMLGRFASFFEDAPRHSGLPAFNELTACIVGGIHATIYRYVAGGRTAELPSLLPLLTYFTLAPFTGPEEAARPPTLAVDQSRSSCRISKNRP